MKIPMIPPIQQKKVTITQLSSDTPWTVNHDADSFALVNLSFLSSDATDVADTGFIRMGNLDVISLRNSNDDGNFSFGLIPAGNRWRILWRIICVSFN